MEEFLRKRESLLFAITTCIFPKKERFLRFFSSKEREFWRLPNGKKHGKEKIFRGEVLSSERMWEDGFLEGEEAVFDRRGGISRTMTWKKGKKHGRDFRKRGDDSIEYWWENGKRAHGRCTSLEGQLLHITHWGTTTTYKENGAILRIYSAGSRGIIWRFTEEGEVKVFRMNSIE